MGRPAEIETGPELRAKLAARFREVAYDYAERLGIDVDPTDPQTIKNLSLDHFCQRADALDRGEPVEVASWELPRGTIAGPLTQAPHFFVLEADGTLTPR